MEMEKRLVFAILLMIGVVVLANLLFPPPRRPPSTAPDTVAVISADSLAVGPRDTAAQAGAQAGPAVPVEGRVDPAEAAAPERAQPAPGDPALLAGAPALPAETVVVRSELYEYRFTTRGAGLIGARLLSHASYAPEDRAGARVELVRPQDALLGFRVAAGADTVDLRERSFGPSVREVVVQRADSVAFRYEFPNASLAFRVTYRFQPDTYLIRVDGALEGVGGRGYTVITSLGRGLETNEANPREDYGQLAYVAHGRGGGYTSGKLSNVEPGVRAVVEGGPFRWVAVKNKYFLAALVSEPSGPGFGGMVVTGVEEENAAQMQASLPVPAGLAAWRFDAFIGPQDYGRLSAAGQELQNVNPYGWRWLRPIIRPLVGLIMAVLVWLHETFRLSYGWVLIVFGVVMRVVLFPLYQKSMRAQMAQMQVQPLIKELQSKYKDDPQKLQQEMVKLYKEHNINPLAGCLPMLLPFPILITLFFVFQNTIEFRGVPFLWLPDLSLKDPYYIIPILMGLSMFLLQWIGQRGMEPNPQMKIMGYALPAVFTFLFMNFASGLNLYYATSNFASLPQQVYLSRERRKARQGEG